MKLDLFLQPEVGHGHLIIFVDVICQSIINALDPLFEQLFDFPHFVTDGDLEPVVFCEHENDLLEQHHDDQVELQLLKVLQVENAEKVADVSVDELEHVDLVDN